MAVVILALTSASCDEGSGRGKPRAPVVAFECGAVFYGDPGPIPPLESPWTYEFLRDYELRLITVDLQDEPLDRLLDEIQLQTYESFKMGAVNTMRRVSLRASKWPLSRTLNHVGNDFDETGMLCGVDPKLQAVYVEALRLSFSLMPWDSHGRREGWVVKTVERQEGIDHGPRNHARVDWNVASVTGWCLPVRVETCGIHSPGLVFIREPGVSSPRVTIRGKRYWYFEVPIEFKKPRVGDVWRGKGYELTLEWPSIRIRSHLPKPVNLLRDALQGEDIRAYRPDGRWLDHDNLQSRNERSRDKEVRFEGSPDRAWCGCPDSPAPASPPPELAREVVFTVDTVCRLEKLETIQLNFHALVEEEFEVTSDPLHWP